MLLGILASLHPHIPGASFCLENWNEIKTMVLTKTMAFIETINAQQIFNKIVHL